MLTPPDPFFSIFWWWAIFHVNSDTNDFPRFSPFTIWRTSLYEILMLCTQLFSLFFLFWSSILFRSLCIKATSNGLWVTANDYVHSPFLFTSLIHFKRYCLLLSIVDGEEKKWKMCLKIIKLMRYLMEGILCSIGGEFSLKFFL